MEKCQKERYKSISNGDRMRYEHQKRRHNQCIAEGRLCSCLDMIGQYYLENEIQ